MTRIWHAVGRRWATTSTTPEKKNAGKKIVTRKKAELRKGPKFRAVYGEKGYVEDTVDRMEESAKEIRGQFVNDDAGADIKPLGRGPKPQWSFLDAPPRGWWPMGAVAMGVPPDSDGVPAVAGKLKGPPTAIKHRGKSSTETTKEARDVWLAELGPVKRLTLGIGRRLTAKEQEKMKFVRILLLFITGLMFILSVKSSYALYHRWKFIQRAVGNEDFKVALMVQQVGLVESVRGREFTDWLAELWKTFPVPNDVESEYELVWRECIKKGWIKLQPDEEWLIAEPFTMRYIPPKGALPVKALHEAR